MRSPNKSRSRNKNNRNRNGNIGNVVNRVFDSNGPEGRVRGTPNQIVEKYEALARDAQLSGDRVEAENFSQHAEHYIRLLAAAQASVAREQAKRQAEHEARQAQKDAERAERAEAAEKSKDDEKETEEREPAPKSKEGEGFDDDNAPDFLKVIND